MMDPRKIGQFLMGEWDKTEQPLQERASVLPLGQYQDGSVGLAWPGMIADPAKRVGNALDAAFKGDQSYYFGDDGHLTNDAIMAGIDATGLAMTGGLGVGLAGGFADNAVGSAGGKLTQPQRMRLPGSAVPEQFRGSAPESPIQPGARDDTGAWFLDGDKPVYTNASRESLDKLFGSEFAKRFDQFPSVATWMPSGENRFSKHTTWYKPSELERALEVTRIAEEGANKTKDYHRRYGLALGYPEDAVEAYVMGRNDLKTNSPSGAAIPLANEAQGNDTEPALLEYLKAIGLY